jgi:hypothetical protein
VLGITESSANIFQRIESVGQIAIGKVVDKAAKLIEACGAIGQRRAEKKACPLERLSVSS